MPENSSHNITPPSEPSSQSSSAGQITMIEMFRQLSSYDGPPEGFLQVLLRLQVQAANVLAGAVLRLTDKGYVEAVATYPPIAPNTTPPVWLATGAELAGETLASDNAVVKGLHGPDDLYGQKPQEHLVLIPLTGGRGSRGLAVFHLGKTSARSLGEIVERLELIVALMNLHELRLGVQRRQNDLKRLRAAMDTLSSTNQHRKFRGTGMALCNEISTRWGCERVSLGVLDGRYIKLKAMSNTEKFSRKMKLVQDIESAMEECCDQDIEIIYPADPNATYVSRASGDLSRKYGPSNVISFPLRREGHSVGVVTIERSADRPFNTEEFEAIRLACELSTARIMDLNETDMWFGKRWAFNSKNYLSILIGPKHTWAKAAAIAIACALAFMLFARGQYSAEGKMTVQPQVTRIIPTPFDGILDSVGIKVGDKVVADQTVLAQLDTAELREQLASAGVERQQALKTEAQAMRDKKTVEAQIARQDVLKAEAKIRLLEYNISQAVIKSPINGTVIEGDLERHVGRRLKLGDAIFQVAQLDDMRAEILIPEDQIADVKPGQKGELATLARPDDHLEFVVERIDPVAQVLDQKNVFKVRVKLFQTDQTLTAGLSGLGKIHVDKRSYAYIWTRKVVNWFRMKLWI